MQIFNFCIEIYVMNYVEYTIDYPNLNAGFSLLYCKILNLLVNAYSALLNCNLFYINCVEYTIDYHTNIRYTSAQIFALSYCNLYYVIRTTIRLIIPHLNAYFALSHYSLYYIAWVEYTIDYPTLKRIILYFRIVIYIV